MMPSAFSQTTRLIQHGIADGLHPGAQLYVSQSGNVLTDAAFGHAREDVPMATDSIVLWMSAVKPITAIAIAKEWERGNIDLDAPVARYVPEFAENGKEAVTIRHVLTHTGGFPNYFVPWSIDCDEAVRKICALPLEDGWVPGQKAGYHPSSGWQMLGEVMRRVTNQVYREYVRDALFLPLGMNDSWIGMPESAANDYADRIAVTLSGKPGSMRPTNHRANHLAQCRPGANGRGPIRELGRFYEMLLAEGDGFIRPETVALFTGLQREGMYDETFAHTMDWGLGFMRNSGKYGRDTVPYGFGDFASEEAYGHGGMQSTMAFCDPKYELVVAWACIGMPGEPIHQQRNRAINNAIYQDLGLA